MNEILNSRIRKSRKKRAKIINKKDYIFYDPFIKSSKYKNLNDLPINKFNNVLLCCSDEKNKFNQILFKKEKIS